MSKETGGPAFPTENERQTGPGSFYYAGMTLRDYLAAHAPEPSLDWLRLQMAHDKSMNPYNDSYKPPIRTEVELCAEYKYQYADAMLTERLKE